MGKHVDWKINRLGLENETPPFRQASSIKAGVLELRPADKYYYSEAQVPCYEFSMFVDGEDAGTFWVRIEPEFEKVREIGNVGIEVVRKFHGRNLPAQATEALLPFFREHGIHSILITFDSGKRAIQKACEKLSARYLDTIDATERAILRSP